MLKGSRKRKLPDWVTLRFKEADRVLGVGLLEEERQKLQDIGFTDFPKPGDAVLPPICLGPTSRFNADGGEIVHKDQPKETAFRQAEWTWKQWSGRYDTEEVSKVCDVPYQRYPRTRVPAPGLELIFSERPAEQEIVHTRVLSIEKDGEKLILHAINLFLELFGRCEVLSPSLVPVALANTRRMNWEVLPSGIYPWATVQPLVKQVLSQEKPGNRDVLERRWELISSFGPEFVAIGRAGFSGYLVFGFPKKGLFVLESTALDNAIYVFDDNWETFAQLSKADIIQGNLARERIVHRKGWDGKVRALLR